VLVDICRPRLRLHYYLESLPKRRSASSLIVVGHIARINEHNAQGFSSNGDRHVSGRQ
jgi:hypothetical protein